MEEVKFTYDLNVEFQHLPEGCPPPSIEPPTEASPCENGYEIGQVISKTIAHIVTPTLVSEDPSVNPELETDEY